MQHFKDLKWNHLKSPKVRVFNQKQIRQKIFTAYASNKPLDVLGSFNATIEVYRIQTKASFYVMKNSTKNYWAKTRQYHLVYYGLGQMLKWKEIQ